MRERSSAVLVALAASSLVASFVFPFTSSTFHLDLPSWLPEPAASRLQDYLVKHARIPVGDHYLASIIGRLFKDGEYFVGSLILFFSVVFPTVKVVGAGTLSLGRSRLPQTVQLALAPALITVAKWSMADVFVVGMIIVFFKAEGLHFTFTARPGIYCYAASALLSTIAVKLLACERVDRSPALDAVTGTRATTIANAPAS
jgi:hypothetical protein